MGTLGRTLRFEGERAEPSCRGEEKEEEEEGDRSPERERDLKKMSSRGGVCGGPLRLGGAARAALALVALALASSLAGAVPLPEINSQVREREERERKWKLLMHRNRFVFSDAKGEKKKRDLTTATQLSVFSARSRQRALPSNRHSSPATQSAI